MELRNKTDISEFLLMGLTDDPDLQPLIFSLFLSINMVTIFGNLLIIVTIIFNSHLHTPMYFFVSNLSFNDIGLCTTIVPQMLVNIQTQDHSITYTGCLTQLCFVAAFAYLENFLLVLMAYDRYVAICHPLRYIIIMSPCLCGILVLFSLLTSFVFALLHTLIVKRLSCTWEKIPHFFCELAQFIKLACSATLLDNLLIYIAFCLLAGFPLCGIILPYKHIISTVLRMPSSGGRYKPFSTCGCQLDYTWH